MGVDRVTLKPCRRCGHQVAESARSCPGCGDRRPHAAPLTGDAALSGERHELLTILFAVIAAGVVISVLTVVWR